MHNECFYVPRATFLEESIFPVLKTMFCSRAMKQKTWLTSKALVSVQTPLQATLLSEHYNIYGLNLIPMLQR